MAHLKMEYAVVEDPHSFQPWLTGLVDFKDLGNEQQMKLLLGGDEIVLMQGLAWWPYCRDLDLSRYSDDWGGALGFFTCNSPNCRTGKTIFIRFKGVHVPACRVLASPHYFKSGHNWKLALKSAFSGNLLVEVKAPKTATWKTVLSAAYPEVLDHLSKWPGAFLTVMKPGGGLMPYEMNGIMATLFSHDLVSDAGAVSKTSEAEGTSKTVVKTPTPSKKKVVAKQLKSKVVAKRPSVKSGVKKRPSHRTG